MRNVRCSGNSRLPHDTMYATDDTGYIVGGARRDDVDGWSSYWPEEARAMALLLGHCDEHYRLLPA